MSAPPPIVGPLGGDSDVISELRLTLKCDTSNTSQSDISALGAPGGSRGLGGRCPSWASLVRLAVSARGWLARSIRVVTTGSGQEAARTSRYFFTVAIAHLLCT